MMQIERTSSTLRPEVCYNGEHFVAFNFIYLDQHVFLARQQVHPLLKHLLTNVNDIRQQFVEAVNLLQLFLQGHAHFVLRRQEHGEILRLLQRLLVLHHFQKLGRSEKP